MRLKEELKLTYIFITHNLSVVEYISDRIAVMYLGRIVELASTEQIFENTMHPYTEALLSAIPVVDPDNKRSRIVLEAMCQPGPSARGVPLPSTLQEVYGYLHAQKAGTEAPYD